MNRTAWMNRFGVRSLGRMLAVGCIAACGLGLTSTASAEPKAAPVVSGGVTLTPVVGAAKEKLLRAFGATRANRASGPAHHECPGGTPHIEGIACGSTNAQQLANTDCLVEGFYGDFYSFPASAGQQVTITMRSTAVDAYLFLFDDEADFVAEDDDSGVGPDETDAQIVFTSDATTTWFIVATSFEQGELGAYTLELECSAAGPCTPSSTALCLNGNRFRVEATFATPAGQSGPAQAVPETSDTGMFWFFTSNNIEAIVKVVNGCGFNQRYWVFAGGLTNVQVTMTVTDLANGTTRTYTNAQGTAFQPIQDTNAFATCP